MMVARRPPHRGRIVSVANACVEQGFYEIAADDIEESHRAGHDPEAVEKVFASIEGTVSRIMGAILQDGFPLPPEHRFKVSLFAALQMTRGWRFRKEMNDLGTFAMHQQERRCCPITSATGCAAGEKPTRADSVAAFRERVLGPQGPRLVMGQAFAVQESLRMALEQITPHLFLRSWRLLRFPDDLLLISDSPVGNRTPSPGVGGLVGRPGLLGRRRQCEHGLPAAEPADRTGDDHAQGARRGNRSGPTRARQINMALIHDAERWIYHHPSDHPLDGIEVPEPECYR